MNPLIGKAVTSVFLTSDKKALRFGTASGEVIIARADGDCCSSTWIESLDAPTSLLGTVVSVEDIPMPNLGQPDEYDVVAYYGCRITTNKGVCVIDYRNSSNGYYGGNLSWPDDAYFYGGVHGQNVSNEDWQRIVP